MKQQDRLDRVERALAERAAARASRHAVADREAWAGPLVAAVVQGRPCPEGYPLAEYEHLRDVAWPVARRIAQADEEAKDDTQEDD